MMHIVLQVVSSVDVASMLQCCLYASLLLTHSCFKLSSSSCMYCLHSSLFTFFYYIFILLLVTIKLFLILNFSSLSGRLVGLTASTCIVLVLCVIQLLCFSAQNCAKYIVQFVTLVIQC